MYCSVLYIGTKNVGKEMKKVTQGRKMERNKIWFPELSDKREFVVCIKRNGNVPIPYM